MIEGLGYTTLLQFRLTSYTTMYTLRHTAILEDTGSTWLTGRSTRTREKFKVHPPMFWLVTTSSIINFPRQLPGRWCHAVSEYLPPSSFLVVFPATSFLVFILLISVVKPLNRFQPSRQQATRFWAVIGDGDLRSFRSLLRMNESGFSQSSPVQASFWR